MGVEVVHAGSVILEGVDPVREGVVVDRDQYVRVGHLGAPGPIVEADRTSIRSREQGPSALAFQEPFEPVSHGQVGIALVESGRAAGARRRVAGIDGHRATPQGVIPIDGGRPAHHEHQGSGLVANVVAPRRRCQVQVEDIAVGADLFPARPAQQPILRPVPQPIGITVGPIEGERHPAIRHIDCVWDRPLHADPRLHMRRHAAQANRAHASAAQRLEAGQPDRLVRGDPGLGDRIQRDAHLIAAPPGDTSPSALSPHP